MATIKDYRIRIEADLEPLEKSLANVGKMFDQMWAGVLKAVGDSQKEIRSEIVKTEKVREKAADSAVKSAKAAAKDVAAESKKSSKVQIDATDAVIEAQEGVIEAGEKVAKAAAEESALTGKARFKATDERITAEIELEEKKLARIQAVLSEELKANEGNQAKILKSREKAQKSTIAAEKKIAGLGKKLGGPAGRPADELAENFATLSESLQKGDIAGAAAGIGQSINSSFGKAAGTIGVIVDLLKGFVSFIGDASKAAAEFNSALSKSAGVAGIAENTAAYEKLENQLLAISRPANISAVDLANLSKQVAGFEPPDQIADTVEAITNLSKLDPDVGVDEIAAGVGRLGESIGDTALAADLLAEVSKNLIGKTVDPLGEALTELGTVSSKAARVIENPAEAARQSAAAFTALTDSGFEVSEATSNTEAIFESLTDTLNNPALLKTLEKNLPNGLSLIDAGFKDGEVDAVKFIDIIQKSGDAGKKLANVIGGTAGEALQSLQVNFNNTNKSVGDFAKQFENVGGAAAANAALLTPVADRLKDAAEQAKSDAFLTFGQNFTAGIDSANQAVSGFFDFLSNPNIEFGPLESVVDLFIDSGVVAERAKNAYQEAAAIADATASVVSNLNAVINDPMTTGEERLKAINENIEGLRNVAPGTAAEIEKLQGAIAEGDPAALERADTLLKQIADSTAFEAIDALNTSLAASQNLIDDLAEESAGFFATIGADALEFVDIWGNFTSADVLSEISDSIDEQIDQSIDKVGELESAYATATEELAAVQEQASAGDEDAAERVITLLSERRAIAKDLNDARLEGQGLDADRAKLVEQTTSALGEQLQAREELAKREGRLFDAAEELEVVLAGQETLLTTQPEIYAEIEKSLQKQLATQGEITTETEGQNEEAEVRLSLQDEQARLLEQQSTQVTQQLGLIRELGVEDSTANARKITQLQSSRAQNDQILQNLRQQLSLIRATGEGEENRAATLQQIAEIEKNINDLKAGTTDVVLEIQPVDTSSFEAQAAAIEDQISAVERFNEELDLTIAELEESEDASQAEREATLEGIRAGEDFSKAQQRAKKATDASTKATDTKGEAELQAAKDVKEGVAERERAEQDLLDKRIDAEIEFNRSRQEFQQQARLAAFAERADQRARAAASQEAQLAELKDQAKRAAGIFGEVLEDSLAILTDPAELTLAQQIEALGRAGGQFGEAVGRASDALESLGESSQDTTIASEAQGVAFRAFSDLLEEGIGLGADPTGLSEGAGDFRGPEETGRTSPEKLVSQLALVKEQADLVRGAFDQSNTAFVDLVKSATSGDFTGALESFRDAREDASGLGDIIASLDNELVKSVADLRTFVATLDPASQEAIQIERALAAIPESLDGFTGGLNEVGTLQEQYLTTISETSDEFADIFAIAKELNKEQEEALSIAEKRELLLNRQKALTEEILLLDKQIAEAQSAGNVKLTNDLTDAQSGLKDSLEDTNFAIESFDQIAGELGGEQLNSVLEKATGIFGQIGEIIDIASGIPDLVDEIAGQFKSGDVGGGIANIADLTTQVGQGLLASGIPPLQTAGAVLLGVGLIGKAIAAIVSFFQSTRLTNVQVAEMEAAKEEKLRDLMESRLDLAEALADAGDKRFDQATEELALIQKQNEALRAQSELAKELAGLSNEEIQNRQDELDLARLRTEAQIELLERESERLSRGELRDLLEEEFGVDVGISSRADAEELLDQLEADLIGINSQLEAGTDEVEARTAELEAQNAVIDQQIDLMSLLVRLGASEVDAARETARLRREQLTNDLDAIRETDDAVAALAKSFGVLDGQSLAELSDEDLKEFLRQAAALDLQQISGDTAELANGWLDAADAAATLTGAVEDLFDRQKRLLELQRDLGEITQEQFTTRTVSLLEERLDLLEAEGEALEAQDASEAAILDNQLARMEIELEIKNLLEAQNAELGETDTILTGLIRKNQQRIREFRAAQEGAPLTVSQRAELESIRQAAVARLTETGATPEEIQAFLDSLPKFETGGPTNAGPIMAHEGEFVVRKRAVDSVGIAFLEDLNRMGANFVNTQAPGNTDAGRFLQSTMNGGDVSVDVGGINVTLNVTSNDPGRATDNIQRELLPALEGQIKSIVNRGIEAGEIDVRR